MNKVMQYLRRHGYIGKQSLLHSFQVYEQPTYIFAYPTREEPSPQLKQENVEIV